MIKTLKQFDNNTAVLLNLSDEKYLVMGRSRKRYTCIQDTTRKTHYSAHDCIYIVIYFVINPIKEVELILNSANVNGIENGNVNFNFNIVSPSRSIIPKHSINLQR